MKELDIMADDVDGAGEEILELFQQNIDIRTIYFDGWNGFGTAAVLTSISQVIQSMEAPPPELHFGRTIYIDCSVWKSKRVMQRKIAEELKLDQNTMVMFDKQDEEDDFNGVAHGSRDVIRKVSAMIDRTLRESRFMMIFLNGSDDELVLSRFGIPEYHDCLIIWTFRRGFLAMHHYNDRKTKDKLRYTDLFLFGALDYDEMASSAFRALFQEEAATIFAPYTCMKDVNPTVATDCCRYGLFLHHILHGSTRFGWAAQNPNLFICDGIFQGDKAIEISHEVHPEISFECDAFILEYIYRKLLYEDLETPSLVIKDYDDAHEKRPYRWIFVGSENKVVQEDMPSLLARASSVFLAFEITNSPPRLPNVLFKQCTSKLGVLILSYCAFSFVSPPFLHCDTLRFLGLDHCTDDITVTDSTAKWTCLYNLWVLDLRYTHWNDILSEEKISLMANLWELNIEGVECWQYTSTLEERLPYLQRLRVINPVHQAEASADINNSFVNKERLEILDLSGNSDMKHLPTSLSKARRLQLLILDGCNGLESVVLPKYPLRSFSFDGYGPASFFTSTVELPTESSRCKPNADEKDVKTSKISLEGCTLLKNLFLRGLHNLVELDLSGCVLIKILDLGTMIVDVPRLKKLFLLGCEHLCAIRWGLDISLGYWERIPKFPVELELLCIDTRPAARSQLRSSLALAQHKSFRLQVHVVTSNARLARSLWAPIHYYLQDIKNDVYFNINISSSTGEVIQPEAATSKEMNELRCLMQHGHVAASAGLYDDVFAKVDDALTLMQAFPQPPTEQLDHHVEIGDGSLNVESEMVTDFDHCNLSDLMKKYTWSLHVHDASTSTTMPIGNLFSLRWCRVERCRNLDTIFQNWGIDKNHRLENIWASDLLMVRCISKKGKIRHFRRLRHLHLRSCPNLQYALPVSEDSIPSLETLHVIHCGNLRHIFVLGTDNMHMDSVLFPQLTNIHLHNLPALEQISEFEMTTPCLKTIKIRGCWSLRRLPCVGYSWWPAPAVEMEKDVWDALEWDGVDDRHHPSLYQAPVHSRYYKRRMLKGTVLR